MIIAFVVLAYIAIGMFIAFYYALDMGTSGDYAVRRAVFWPLYTIRWIVTSFILALRGL